MFSTLAKDSDVHIHTGYVNTHATDDDDMSATSSDFYVTKKKKQRDVVGGLRFLFRRRRTTTTISSTYKQTNNNNHLFHLLTNHLCRRRINGRRARRGRSGTRMGWPSTLHQRSKVPKGGTLHHTKKEQYCHRRYKQAVC
ncbi:hypothetical protein QYF36_021187 [Acer negundo]|nr:hypothetical protein QYF36_017132 [Acer negundo]KAK4840909.1 hypothetical protein QYF36_021187 [Acer negundo]